MYQPVGLYLHYLSGDVNFFLTESDAERVVYRRKGPELPAFVRVARPFSGSSGGMDGSAARRSPPVILIEIQKKH
jgi:hypothetical protein